MNFRLRPLTGDNGTLVTWTPLEEGSPETKHAQILTLNLAPEWESLPFYINDFDPFLFMLGAHLGSPVDPAAVVPTQLPAASPDAEVFQRLQAEIAGIQQTVVTNHATWENAPVPPPPHPDAKCLYRLERTLPDSDGDGLPDYLEIHAGLTDPFNSDTDGDGTPDGQDPDSFPPGESPGAVPPDPSFSYTITKEESRTSISGMGGAGHGYVSYPVDGSEYAFDVLEPAIVFDSYEQAAAANVHFDQSGAEDGWREETGNGRINLGQNSEGWYGALHTEKRVTINPAPVHGPVVISREYLHLRQVPYEPDTIDVIGTVEEELLIPVGETTSDPGEIVEATSPSFHSGKGFFTETMSEGHDEFLLPVDLKVDANRDGKIKFNSDDIATEEEPFHFWINSDRDTGNDAVAMDLNPDDGNADSTDDTIHCLRDLEDFAQLALNAGGIAELIASNAIEVGFRFVDIKQGNPRIRVYHAENQEFSEELDGRAYLETGVSATAQMNHANGFARVDTGTQDLDLLPKHFFDGTLFPEITTENPVVRFIFEGVSEGEGTLALVIKVEGGMETEVPLVPIKLSKVTDMYEHWTVGDTTEIAVSAIPTTPIMTPDSGTYTVNSLEDDDCIVFVHGWRMQEWERRYFASTAYKRLWHQGFKGRFFQFSWPTEWVARVDWIPGNPPLGDEFPPDLDNYADSEEKAFHSAEGLLGLLSNLKNEYGANKVRLFSHSMGGVVASEALRLHTRINGSGQLVHTYAPCQAAMVAHAYDPEATLRTASALNLGSWDTPEVYADYPFTPSEPYFESLSDAGAIINFHNFEDKALDAWLAGQDLKPNAVAPPEGYHYGTALGPGFQAIQNAFFQSNPTAFDRVLNFPNETYEIYAHAAEARSFALGAEAAPAFPAVDLNSVFSIPEANFTDLDQDHSAQFLAVNMIRHEFWYKLLEEFDLLDDEEG